MEIKNRTYFYWLIPVLIVALVMGFSSPASGQNQSEALYITPAVPVFTIPADIAVESGYSYPSIPESIFSGSSATLSITLSGDAANNPCLISSSLHSESCRYINVSLPDAFTICFMHNLKNGQHPGGVVPIPVIVPESPPRGAVPGWLFSPEPPPPTVEDASRSEFNLPGWFMVLLAFAAVIMLGGLWEIISRKRKSRTRVAKKDS